MLALRVNDGYGNTGEETKRYKPLLAVGEPIIFEGEGDALEYAGGIHEIQSVSFQVRGALRL